MMAYYFKHKKTGKTYKVLRVFEKDGKRYVELQGKVHSWPEEYDKDSFTKRGYTMISVPDEEEAA
jgi:hypothetical protein